LSGQRRGLEAATPGRKVMGGIRIHEGRARGTKRVGRAEGSVGGVQRGAVKVPTRQRAWAERRSEERSRSAGGAQEVGGPPPNQ